FNIVQFLFLKKKDSPEFLSYEAMLSSLYSPIDSGTILSAEPYLRFNLSPTVELTDSLTLTSAALFAHPTKNRAPITNKTNNFFILQFCQILFKFL
ncbi:MAG: hypothetical protein J7K36_01205, partial [Archaeoglobaceae archaeon]|nr:hypothetical protein [Archaeoglobaceae archaeon]